jgi:type I restriction enzyme S subunit
MKFQNGDTIMARITPCLENGKAGFVNYLDDGQVGFGSTEYIVLSGKPGIPNELLYFLVRDEKFVAYATQNMNGTSGRQRVSGDVIGQYSMAIATRDVYDRIAPVLSSFLEKMRMHFLQNSRLASLRDALLPKLMRGEIDVEKVEVAG